MLKALLAFVLLFSEQVYAHPGHDHGGPFAWMEHLLWLAPAIIAVGIVFYIKRQKASDKE